MDTLQVIGYYPLPPFVVAQEKGLFTREGLAIDFTIATLAPEHNKGMLEGRWDISLTSPDTMVARVTRDGHGFLLYLMAERGLEVKLIGARGIKSPAELRGKTLAGDPGDSNYDLHRRKILRAHGVTDSEYAVKIIGTSPYRFEALRQGEVAACMLAPPYDAQALSEGYNLLASGADYIPNYATTACWAQVRLGGSPSRPDGAVCPRVRCWGGLGARSEEPRRSFTPHAGLFEDLAGTGGHEIGSGDAEGGDCP